MSQIKITQVKSGIGRPERQKRTLQALGLRHPHAVAVHLSNPQILGMVAKVAHLVKVEAI
ncbi:MAG: 50S ribosomal protein L30 [Bacteroidetes bacterium]|jgi:large subunit ribosomal protein L30|nr:50S ribosomal protein L30 [Bacteroidota bacterium]